MNGGINNTTPDYSIRRDNLNFVWLNTTTPIRYADISAIYSERTISGGTKVEHSSYGDVNSIS
jgi:hypothetical protein